MFYQDKLWVYTLIKASSWLLTAIITTSFYSKESSNFFSDLFYPQSVITHIPFCLRFTLVIKILANVKIVIISLVIIG